MTGWRRFSRVVDGTENGWICVPVDLNDDSWEPGPRTACGPVGRLLLDGRICIRRGLLGSGSGIGSATSWRVFVFARTDGQVRVMRVSYARSGWDARSRSRTGSERFIVFACRLPMGRPEEASYFARP